LGTQPLKKGDLMNKFVKVIDENGKKTIARVSKKSGEEIK